jgi:hypothetical protein
VKLLARIAKLVELELWLGVAEFIVVYFCSPEFKYIRLQNNLKVRLIGDDRVQMECWLACVRLSNEFRHLHTAQVDDLILLALHGMDHYDLEERCENRVDGVEIASTVEKCLRKKQLCCKSFGLEQ